MFDLLLPTISQGLLWSLLALGVYITFRVLDIADLTVEGSFPLGASVAVTLLVKDVNPVTAILAAALAGGVAGVITGLLHTKLRIPALLAGILTMIALYSVNLRIMGKANISLLGKETAFTLVESNLGVAYSQAVLLVGLISCVLFSVLMYWFFGTEIGAAIRATGFNPQMIRAQGVDTNIMLLIGLFIAFFVVFCCMNFHRRILSPAFRQFEEDRRESRRRMDELQLERQQMQTELSRLADVCRNESVPDAFQTFVAGIPTLTKTERRIFDGYAAGLRTREIVEQLDIKDSTLRFHNKNIYEKLGVNSLKQLQQFVAILNSGSGSAPDEK